MCAHRNRAISGVDMAFAMLIGLLLTRRLLVIMPMSLPFLLKTGLPDSPVPVAMSSSIGFWYPYASSPCGFFFPYWE